VSLAFVRPIAALLLLSCAAEVEPPAERWRLHRLNRTEYDRTVRDLLGTPSPPTADFPPDGRAFGFDNIRDALTLSPLQVELYARAAEALAEDAVAPLPSRRIEVEELSFDLGARHRDMGWKLPAGRYPIDGPIDAPGLHRVSIRALGVDGAIGIDRDGAPLAEGPVGEDGTILEASLTASSSGAIGLGVQVTAGVVLDWIRIDGPEPTSRRSILDCGRADRACAEETVRRIAEAAYRRPLGPGDRDLAAGPLRRAVEDGETLERGVAASIRSILLSPRFLFRSEVASDEQVDPFELASRLSYFLWSSMPDDRLIGLARDGSIADPSTLSREVDRMLADPKAGALAESFAGQWLFGRGVRGAPPDPANFPELDDALRTSAEMEQRLFFASLVAEDRPVTDVLLADHTFADDRLARHYGLPFEGDGFRRVDLSGGPRRGVLGQAAVHMVTSHPDRTSPTKRGKWVLEQLLCASPPPPPPGVEGLPPVAAGGSTRERLEAHRSRPECRACHQVMDPIGFGLEVFDPIGRIRSEDEGGSIDPSGLLPDGASFAGPRELAEVLAARPDFRRCVVEKVMTYALGRGLSDDDEVEARAIAADVGAIGWRELIRRVVFTEAFQRRVP
jgi:hypothetical protein